MKSLVVTIQIHPLHQYFYMVLFLSFSPFYNLMEFGIAVEFHFGRFWQWEGLDQQKWIKITWL